jgi:hypothetical protein
VRAQLFAPGVNPIRTAMSLYSNDSANPREISSRSANVSILRTMSILTRQTQDHMLRLPELARH